MWTLTHYRALERLDEVADLSRLYAAHDPAFAPRVIAWLDAADLSLRQLRNPLAGRISAEKARLLAVPDGWRPASLGDRATRANSALRACAALALEQVAAWLEALASQAEQRLNEPREKLIQLLAVHSAHQPLPLPRPGEEPREWAERCWRDLPHLPQTQSMRTFLAGSLSRGDLVALLAEVLDRLRDNAALPCHPPLAPGRDVDHGRRRA
ncbi:MAG: hypothetical protein IPG93_03705 [Burkholderiales bacterium]|jgi:hypothetical protein|nr:hypothetical protein [Burkholderiales bacterium]